MFTWICPQCGREVPPAYTECPNCAGKPAGAYTPPQGQAVASGQPPPVQQNAAASQQYAAAPPAGQQPPVYAAPVAPPPMGPPPRSYYAPQPARAGLPTWLMTVLFALAFVGLGSGIYWLVGYMRGRSGAPAATVESPAAKPGAATNPLQKYIEISGLRFVEDGRKKLMAKFVVTNHSGAEISGLAGNVTIWASTRKSEEDAQGTFAFTTSLGAYDSKEVTAPLTTKLKVYELPDWQNVTTDLQITAPASTGAGGLP